jgi:hypothetical protein
MDYEVAPDDYEVPHIIYDYEVPPHTRDMHHHLAPHDATIDYRLSTADYRLSTADY